MEASFSKYPQCIPPHIVEHALKTPIFLAALQVQLKRARRES